MVTAGRVSWDGTIADRRLQDRRKSALALAVALVALSTVDIMVTNLGIAYLGSIELNPIMQPLLGTAWASVAKIGIPAIIVVLTPFIVSPRIVTYLRLTVAVYIVVVISGVAQVSYFIAKFQGFLPA